MGVCFVRSFSGVILMISEGFARMILVVVFLLFCFLCSFLYLYLYDNLVCVCVCVRATLFKNHVMYCASVKAYLSFQNFSFVFNPIIV